MIYILLFNRFQFHICQAQDEGILVTTDAAFKRARTSQLHSSCSPFDLGRFDTSKNGGLDIFLFYHIALYFFFSAGNSTMMPCSFSGRRLL